MTLSNRKPLKTIPGDTAANLWERMNASTLKILMLSTSLLMASSCQYHGSKSQVTRNLTANDYARAEAFLPKNITKKVKNLTVRPQWVGTQGDFWFKQTSNSGSDEYFLTRASSGITSTLFETKLLANLVSNHDKSYSTDSIKLSSLKINDSISKMTFTLESQPLECDLPLVSCRKVDDEKSIQKQGYYSPDGLWKAEVIDWDLYLTNTETNKKTRITFDGVEGYPYAVNNRNPRKDFDKEIKTISEELSLFWSPDGKTLVTHRLDRRNVGKLHLVQSVTGKGLRPRLYSYYYPLAGDKHIPQGDVIAINLTDLKPQKLKIPPLLQTYYGGPIWGWWESENNKFYIINHSRGYQQIDLHEYNPATRKSRLVLSEKEKTFIDPWTFEVEILAESNELIWSSQKSGKQQLYLHDLKSGKLKNKITQCDCYVRNPTAIDKEKRILYFEASGEHQDRDPYYVHFYRVNLDGTEQKLLTPEATNHYIQLSPNFEYFIDTQSTVSQRPKNILRSTKDPSKIFTVGKPDVSELIASGWDTPEPFKVLANDDQTMLYGLIYKPSNFDPKKKYPIIDAVYTGPHGFFTPKSYWSYWGQESALAELGFIVIKMDGRGTNKRDRKFHEASYQNLAGGVDDHVFAIKALAKERSYMDIERVGVFGFSAGGYDTAQAMFRHSDFFKVGVSASGNHDFRTDKTGWNETWLGYPLNKHYDEQTNLNPESVKKLKGKLLLAHGELDENVNPAATLQLVDALIKANKDFDLMIYPNQNHVLNGSDYFVRKRWDYFVKHLLKVEYPEEYQFRLNEK